ncbi:hypothetical protein BDV29DRAFT_173588 [Aspergillus leporis]|uniref:DUF202 domain-containing protein n=1 Tax=Aspergillus leporis TaxID=41062 RepID=A0A5N5X104_9EURO|nr:hypothetical protein BDV29DRAFT_173588 [Aspergillus leporis]
MDIELDSPPGRRKAIDDVPHAESSMSGEVHSKQKRRRIQKWWTTNICSEVAAEDGDPRDFLALERTYLAYVRTGNALASFAIVAAQLFILHHDSVVAGKVLSCLSLVFAIYTTLVGSIRYFKQQRSLQQKKCYLWNPENIRITLVFFSVSV